MTNRLAPWILGVAVGCFAAGMVAGLVMPSVVAACCGDDRAADPDDSYVQQLAADFDLSTAQRRQLRVVLQRYREEQVEVFRHANFEQLPAGLQAELTAARRRQSDRIYALLNAGQRDRYDERSRASGSVR